MSADLEDLTCITHNYPGSNGLATDSQGVLYITTGDFNFINPKGSLTKIGMNNNDMVLKKAKSANGLYYDDKSDCLYYSEVYSGIYKYDILNRTESKVLGKSKIVEGFDDFCVDNNNNIWIADPPADQSMLKADLNVTQPEKKRPLSRARETVSL